MDLPGSSRVHVDGVDHYGLAIGRLFRHRKVAVFLRAIEVITRRATEFNACTRTQMRF